VGTNSSDLADPRAHRNFERTEMRIRRQKTPAVVEDHGVSGKR
jgi:hypothetical protein